MQLIWSLDAAKVVLEAVYNRKFDFPYEKTKAENLCSSKAKC